MIEWLLPLLFGAWLGPAKPVLPAVAPGAPRPAGTAAALPGAPRSELDRLAAAVEGAESSYGRDPLMWKPNFAGPQGPMQVTLAASREVGNTDRFDLTANRQIGRDYLAVLFRRYGNWPDTVAAYNWGPGNLDRWIASGRSPAAMAAPIQNYIERVLREFRSTMLERPAAVAQLAVLPSPLPAAAPPQIRDPALRRAYERNAAAIKGLSGFLAGDTGAESAVRAAVQQVAQRPGYDQFRELRLSDPRRVSPAALRQVAEVLLGKLRSENAAIVLVDGKRHGKLP